MNISAGELFNGRYRLISEKGRGAFGEVWLAHDEQIDLDVAVKIYIALDDRGIDDFKSEYKNAYSLNHPNLLHAYHFDVIEKRPFLVMPYCPGSAETLVGTTDEKEIWRFVRDVANGLKFLHSKNILHRDIKPDNILADKDGNYLITDFGVSTKMKSTLRRNSTRAISNDDISGTIGYMAPELFTKTPEAVKATDVWAFGATIFELINQELPFYGQGGIMLEKGAEIPELKGSWSEYLRLTVEACLAKETWDRPTAAQLEDYADDCVKGNFRKAPWKTAEKKAESGNGNVPFGGATVKVEKKSNDGHKELSDSERLEICAICRNRSFDKSLGIICGRTNKKPTFANSCPSIIIDEEEKQRRDAKKAEAESNDSNIHGWTAFFLWVGIGCGLLISTISTFSSVFAGNTDAFTIWYSLIYLAFFLFIGIKAIVAFYKHKDNAVSLATTYCIMIAIDALFLFALYLMGAADNAWQTLRNLIWAGIWMTFLYCSEDVKEICPKETRSWHSAEVVVLSLYFVMTIIMTILCFAGTNNQNTYVPETKPSTTVQKPTSTTTQSDSQQQTVTKTQDKPTEGTTDDRASKLQSAVRDGDYATVKQLADAGYSAAYVPLAKYYLKNPATHDLADQYAKKAKRAGVSGAQSIIDDLTALGYYD